MRKKLFAILMSAMMMVTFMPSMAFATDAPKSLDGKVLDIPAVSVVHELKSTETVVSPDCYHATKIVKQTYKNGDVEVVVTEPGIKHHYVTEEMSFAKAKGLISGQVDNWLKDIAEKVMTGEEIDTTVEGIARLLLGVAPADKQVANEIIAEIKEAIYAYQTAAEAAEDDSAVFAGMVAAVKTLLADYFNSLGNKLVAYAGNNTMEAKAAADDYYCYFRVNYCDKCKAVESAIGFKHEKPAGTAACATSYVCAHCNNTINVYSAHVEQDVVKILKQFGKVVVNGEVDYEELSVLANELYFFDAKEKGHDFAVTKEKKTCGIAYTLTCSKCGETLSFTLPTSIKHKFQEETLVAADCSKVTKEAGRTGLTVEKCVDCGAINILSFKEAEMKHSYTEQTIAPTCTLPGYTVNVCDNCGNVVPVTSKKFSPATGHDYSIEMLVEPGCGKEGLLKIECKNCGRIDYYTSFEDNEVVEVGSLKDLTKENLAKYPKSGIVKVVDKLHDESTYYFLGFTLDLLKAPIKLTSPAKTLHKFATWGITSAATCTAGTTWAPKCVNCGLVAKKAEVRGDLFVEKDALGHDVETIVVPATCNTEGYSYKVCKRCHYTLNKDGEIVANKSVPTVDGTYKLPKNYVVDDTFKFDKKAPLVGIDAAHKWNGNFSVVKKATIFEAGCLNHTCSVCGVVDGTHVEELPKLTYKKSAVTAGKKKATVKVVAQDEAVKYTVQYRLTGKANAANWKNAKTVTKAGKVTVKSLKGGKKYNFRVVAQNAAGQKAYSAVTSSVKIKK